jgi:hypothetical protein
LEIIDPRQLGTPALWEWDLGTGAMWFSAALAGVLGMPVQAFEADSAWWTSQLDPTDAQRRSAVVDAALRGDTSRWRCPCRVRTVAGSWVEVVELGFIAPGGAHATAVGILRPAREEQSANSEPSLRSRIEDSDRQFRTFVDFLPQLAWMTDASGWTEFYNRRWYEYTGTTFAQMEGWGWISVHDPHDLPRSLRIFRDALDSGQPWEDEFRLRRSSDGMLRWHLSRAMPLRDARGRIVRWLGTNTDIHDQKLAADESSRRLASEEQLRREAEAASRAKDEFLAVVSHELRTPLNAILGWSRLLAQKTLPPEKLRLGLTKIEANAGLQARLIEELLDVSRIITGKLAVDLEPLVLGDVVACAVESAGPAADEKEIALVFSDSAGGAYVRGNAPRLQQIVSNLLSNALKFTPRGGRVAVDVTRDGEWLAIRVADTGAGIDRELLPRVFERFTQGDSTSTRAHGGLGLGLAIARELAHLHGGDATADSPGVGGGATFTVRLPVLAAAEAAASAGPHHEAQPAPSSLAGIKVLAVDDEASAREILSEILLSCGATVTLASSVPEALRSFKLDPPDVVVSDLAMPDLDGNALLKRIRALGDPAAARTPVIALTAYASLQDRGRALALGFNRHLAKPVDGAHLAAMIAELAVRAPTVHHPG